MPIILLIVIACTRHFSRFRLRSYGLQPGSFLCPLLLLLLSHSVMSDSLRPHRLQHTRLPCPSPSPGACSNSCLSSWWRHSTVSSSVVPFSSCLQPFPASGSFLISHFFTSGGQSIGVSASASVPPMNIQDWFPLGLVGSPCSPRDSKGSSSTPQLKRINSSALSFLYGPTFTSIYDYCVGVRRIRRAFLPKNPNFSFPLKLFQPNLAHRELQVPACPVRSGRKVRHFRSTQRLCPRVSTCHWAPRLWQEKELTGGVWGAGGGGGGVDSGSDPGLDLPRRGSVPGSVGYRRGRWRPGPLGQDVEHVEGAGAGGQSVSIGGQLWPRPTRGRGGGEREPVLRSGPSASRPPDGSALSWRRATLFSARGRVPIRQPKGPFLCRNILVPLSPIQAFLTLQLPHPSRRGHFDQGRGQGCLELGHCPGRRTVLAPGFWSLPPGQQWKLEAGETYFSGSLCSSAVVEILGLVGMCPLPCWASFNS